MDVKELSANLNSISKQSKQDNRKIINLRQNKEALELRVNKLTEKVESQEEQIDKLRQDNFNLKYRLQQLEYLFKKLVNFLKRMINRKNKEDIYVEVVDDMYNNQIISEKTYYDILGFNKDLQKEKDDFEL